MSRVVRVLFGPWPIRPVFIGVLTGLLFQFSAADITSPARLSFGKVLSAMPLAVTRGAAVALSLWIALTVYRQLWHGRPLTRTAYLAITAFAAVCAGTARFLLSEGSITEEPRLYFIFVLRSMFLFLMLQLTVGLADERLRTQVSRADSALAQVERQQRMVMESEERAKDQVSRFLHNRVQAGLVTIGMEMRQLELESPPPIADRIRSIRDALETVRAEDVRQASRALSPDISTNGLAQALQELADRYSPGVSVRLIVTGETSASTTVTPEQLLGCYRIVEQGLLNSVIHGQSTQIDIDVSIAGSEIVMIMDDNGAGLTTQSPVSGTGMALLDAWTSRFDGAWSLTNRSGGKGARLSARLSSAEIS
jgi:signal transduction histidine kinase